jgi:hypothetical protein
MAVCVTDLEGSAAHENCAVTRVYKQLSGKSKVRNKLRTVSKWKAV